MKSENCPKAVLGQFLVNGMKVIACSMARKSNVQPFVSPPYPLHRSLILIGDQENSTNFLALFFTTHLPFFLSVHSLILIIVPAPKGCQLYSIQFSKASFSLLVFCWTSPSARDQGCSPPNAFAFLVSDPLALPWLWQCLAMHPCGRNSFQQCFFFSHSISSHCGASSVLTLPDKKPGGMG